MINKIDDFLNPFYLNDGLALLQFAFDPSDSQNITFPLADWFLPGSRPVSSGLQQSAKPAEQIFNECVQAVADAVANNASQVISDDQETKVIQNCQKIASISGANATAMSNYAAQQGRSLNQLGAQADALVGSDGNIPVYAASQTARANARQAVNATREIGEPHHTGSGTQTKYDAFNQTYYDKLSKNRTAIVSKIDSVDVAKLKRGEAADYKKQIESHAHKELAHRLAHIKSAEEGGATDAEKTQLKNLYKEQVKTITEQTGKFYQKFKYAKRYEQKDYEALYGVQKLWAKLRDTVPINFKGQGLDSFNLEDLGWFLGILLVSTGIVVGSIYLFNYFYDQSDEEVELDEIDVPEVQDIKDVQIPEVADVHDHTDECDHEIQAVEAEESDEQSSGYSLVKIFFGVITFFAVSSFSLGTLLHNKVFSRDILDYEYIGPVLNVVLIPYNKLFGQVGHK
jgi:hypothetical protein